MNKKKRLEWILRGPLPPEERVEIVFAILDDLEYSRVDSSSGSHFVYCRDGEVEQKTVPVKSGKKVKRPYLMKIRKNAIRIMGG